MTHLTRFSPVTMSRIIDDQASRFGLTRVEMLAHDRCPQAYAARLAAACIARGMGYPLTSIGRALGRDHTTIMLAIRKAAA